MKKKPYSLPTIGNLTPEQAKKIIADRKNCTEEEAAEFLESLQRRQQQNDQKRNEAQTATRNMKGSAQHKLVSALKIR